MLNNLIIFGAQYLIWIIAIIAIGYIAKQKKEKQLRIILLGIIILPISYVVAKILARFYYDPRPFVVNNFVPLIFHEADNGFPSDHTLLGAAIASVISLFNKKTGIILFILALLVGISRVLIGIHHTVDIIGSLAIAIAVAGLVYSITNKYLKL